MLLCRHWAPLPLLELRTGGISGCCWMSCEASLLYLPWLFWQQSLPGRDYRHVFLVRQTLEESCHFNT